MAINGGSVTDVFACHSQSKNNSNNRSDKTAFSSTKNHLIAKDGKLTWGLARIDVYEAETAIVWPLSWLLCG